IAIEGINEKVRPLTIKEIDHFNALKIDEESFKKQAGLRSGVEPHKSHHGFFEAIWRKPSLSVNAIQASSKHDARNIICDSAWARIGIRIVPDLDPDETLRALTEHIKARTPWGLEVNIKPETASIWWYISTAHPAFEAAFEALRKG